MSSTTIAGERYGYLLVHFIENPHEHNEKIYFSLSDGNDPMTWRRLGMVVESTLGTGGVRDPHIVRDASNRFHVVATDLRVWRPEGADWDQYRHRGSRDIVLWVSDDLISWGDARTATLAPDGAGMAWAPESTYDAQSGDHLVYWSSGLAAEGQGGKTGPSSILVSRTADYETFSEPEVYLQLPVGVIDMTVHITPTAVHRFAKQDDKAPGSWHVFHQRGSSFFADDFVTLCTDIGQDIAEHVEGPLVFKDNTQARWYLWLDQYATDQQGYRAFMTDDLESGEWTLVPDFAVPANTKHGAVLPLFRHEYDALTAHWNLPTAAGARSREGAQNRVGTPESIPFMRS